MVHEGSRSFGCALFYPKYGSILDTIRCDGKPYPLTGPTALPGMTTAAQPLGTRSVRRTTFRAEQPTLEIEMTVSADGRIMTISTHPPGTSDEPSQFVYEKQD
jgi:hypothetical protein